MRKITPVLLAVLLACLAAAPALAVADFTWEVVHHIQHGPDFTYLEYHGVVTNTGDARDSFTIHKSAILPDGSFSWAASICVGEFCYAPFVDDVTTDSIDPGGTLDIRIDITIGTELGNAYGQLTVGSVLDPLVTMTKSFAAIHDDCDLLVVDDTGEGYGAYASFDALQAALGGKVAGHWPRDLELPLLADLQTWPMTFWTADVAPTLDADDRALLESFLAADGSLLLSGEDLAYDVCEVDLDCDWLMNTCGLVYLGDNGSPTIEGVAGSDVGDGLGFTLAGGADPDLVGLARGGAVQFESVGSGATGILQTDGARLLYLGFNLVDVPGASLTPLLAASCDALAQPSSSGTPGLPTALVLHQNQPNPFNPKTNLRFAAPAAGTARIEVMDVTGRQVAAFGASVREGENTLPFDGNGLASGTYLYRVVLGDEVVAGKMTLLK